MADLKNPIIETEPVALRPQHATTVHVSNFTSSGGNPMCVIIQRENNFGRVITASPRKNIVGPTVWDSDSGIYTSYDDRSDILYISHGDSRPCYADDDDEGDSRLWLRFYEDDNSPAGITVFEARALWADQTKNLKSKIADFLSISENDLKKRVDRVLG